MIRQRHDLPQLTGRPFITDGGLETVLFFQQGIDLPEFAAFPLLATARGRDRFRAYFRRYADLAVERGLGFIFESMTWRASRDWGARLGFAPGAVADFNRQGLALMNELRDEYAGRLPAAVVSGCVGPRVDGYIADQAPDADTAHAYHAEQIGVLAETGADLVTAYTMPCSGEAVGVARAARDAGMPVAIGFTVETDGRLPSGETLAEAIARVDAVEGGAPAYFMINCAHPSHFAHALDGGDWRLRIRAVRANASACSHAELDEATELDDGDPVDLGERYRELRRLLPSLNIVGGCCGTDHRHVEMMCGCFE